MTVWDDVVGQPMVVNQLQNAAHSAREIVDHGASARLAHAWLFTGPPGSGRSVAAQALAAALQCVDPNVVGCGHCSGCRLAETSAHPDITTVRTETMMIDIAHVRSLIETAQRHPSLGRWRVIVIEDADRMADRTWNVLLKSIEEPPQRTIWMLCAPSADDVLPTINSRCRGVRLQLPSVEMVAQYVAQRDGVDADTALRSARAALGHIGLARRLARNEDARDRRNAVTRLPFEVNGVGYALRRAAELVETADDEAKSSSVERNAEEVATLKRMLGVPESDPFPRALKPHEKRLADEQKRRTVRMQADVLDRTLLDVQSVYRDVLMLQLGSHSDLVNPHLDNELCALAAATTATTTLHRIDMITQARQRITGQTRLNRLLAVEAMVLQLVD